MTYRPQPTSRRPAAFRTEAFSTEPSDELSRRLTAALEAAPSFTIPPDFAARTALAAAHLPEPAPPFRFSKLAIRSAFALLLLAILLLTPWARTLSTVAIAVELLLALELAALSTWLSLRPQP